jgi:hypothetical protein
MTALEQPGILTPSQAREVFRTGEVPVIGDAGEPWPGDVPVFWACGVTSQAVVIASAAPYVITHSPDGCSSRTVRLRT